MSTKTDRKATVTLDIDIDGHSIEVHRSTLREAGWVEEAEAHAECRTDDDVVVAFEKGAREERQHLRGRGGAVQQVMASWHNEHHEGVVRFCYQQPCKDLRDVADWG